LGLTTAVDDVKYAVGLKPDNDQDQATDKDGTRKGPGKDISDAMILGPRMIIVAKRGFISVRRRVWVRHGGTP
jgi:hypothetical protein